MYSWRGGHCIQLIITLSNTEFNFNVGCTNSLSHSLRDEIGTVLSGIGAWICTYHNQCHVGKYLIKALCAEEV